MSIYHKNNENIVFVSIARFFSSSFHGPFHILEICVVTSPKIATSGRPSDNLIEVFGPDQITNLRARVDG